VKVRNISKDDHGQQIEGVSGIETIITYKAYRYTQEQFELLYQCDESGKQVVDQNGNANPNLEAQHQAIAKIKNAAPVVNSGPVVTETKMQDNPDVHPETVTGTHTPAPQKRGPKRKVELQEHTA
jgi:hypothetical protein